MITKQEQTMMRSSRPMPIAPRVSMHDNRSILRRDVRLETAVPRSLQLQPRSIAATLRQLGAAARPPPSDLDVLALLSCRSLALGNLLPPPTTGQILRARQAIRGPIVPPMQVRDRIILDQLLRDSQRKSTQLKVLKQASQRKAPQSAAKKLGVQCVPTITVGKAEESHFEDHSVLRELGETALERRAKKIPYFDASTLPDVPQSVILKRRVRGGVSEPFPEKLYRMLIETEERGLQDIISFYPHGRAFGIHKPERFAKEIMPLYFNMGKVNSFQRQLNLYGFVRVGTGQDIGAYYHELLLKGRPALSMNIVRVGTPKAVPRRRGVKAQGTLVDPEFYSLPPISQSPS